MIVTLTPNPSVDRTVEVNSLIEGEVIRSTARRLEAGGKGINISRALAASGLPTIAILPVGGSEGLEILQLLESDGVRVVPVAISGSIRMNLSIATPNGVVTKINEPGPTLSGKEQQDLIEAVRKNVAIADWVVASGTLPQEVGDDFYARVIDAVRSEGGRIALDTSGMPLLASLKEKPDLIKPNLEELAEAVGRPLVNLGQVVEAAKELIGLGARSVIASLGGDGAVYVDSALSLHGEAEAAIVRSTVGAGDSLLAGFLAGNGGPKEQLANGLSWAVAAVEQPGTAIGSAEGAKNHSVSIYTEIDVPRKIRQRGI